jgi:hypothetical protein
MPLLRLPPPAWWQIEALLMQCFKLMLATFQASQLRRVAIAAARKVVVGHTLREGPLLCGSINTVT